jgi:hypothetical protein
MIFFETPRVKRKTCPPAQVRSTPEAAHARLQALSFDDKPPTQ